MNCVQEQLKVKVKLPHVNKKPQARKQNLFKNRFLSLLKIRAKKFTPQNQSLFRSTSWFGVTKITTPF